ncbi:MAG TPA: xanthine dehydrogenase family protein molybdopterin-binding subunit [Candidatus Dormibacteraeota bacterium]|nr:xanthine dehydrogenase family protein molybdopterin-binding subunit [Candidatus Dormibacteraeota bacterium]
MMLTKGSGRATGPPWVGEGLRRREDPPLLQGKGCFVDDLRVEGMAHMAVLRSPLPHARIRSIDTTAARARAGVLAVLTAGDLMGTVDPMPVSSREGAEVAPAPVPLLAREKVRFVGEPVLAVVAESREVAEDTLGLVQVEYESLPPLLEPRLALESRIALHDHIAGNVLLRWARSSGDVEARFSAASLVVRARFHLPRLVAAPIEPRGCLAAYDPTTDLLTLWCSAQDPHRPLHELEMVLRRPAGRTRVVVPDVGGAFGSKGTLAPEYGLAALAAMRLHRPVKWGESRSENFLASYQGRGLDADVELALEGDGRFSALRARLLSDLGAYLYPVSSVSPTCTAMMLTGAYDIPAAAVEVVGVATNKAPTGPYRGAGRPEATLIMERLVDMAARALDMDPAELRRRNLVPSDAFPYRNALGYTYDSGDYRQALLSVQEMLPYAAWRARQAAGRAEGRLIGIGLATFVDRSGPGLWERTRLSVQPSGRVVAQLGSSPHGQGHETTFAQIAADALGIAPESIEVRHGDSAEVPEGMGTYGSRSVAIGGSALVRAAEAVKEKARLIAAHLLEVAPEDLVWEAGRIHVAGTPARGMGLEEVAQAAVDPDRLPPGLPPGLEATSRFSLPGLLFPFGAYAAVVEVDRETGEVKVLRLATVDDAGTLVNPRLAEGQVHGGIAQGLAATLWEEVVHGDDGQPVTTSFLTYDIPTAAEVAVELEGRFQATPSPFNPLGAKGIGESGAIGAPAAVANAVVDALAPLGIEHVDPPYTPERLWRLIRAADGEAR